MKRTMRRYGLSEANFRSGLEAGEFAAPQRMTTLLGNHGRTRFMRVVLCDPDLLMADKNVCPTGNGFGAFWFVGRLVNLRLILTNRSSGTLCDQRL
jgi:hypothetical protein